MTSNLLLDLQQNVPLERRPFAQLGTLHGLDETAVLDTAQRYFNAGLVRRFGAVFEGRLLGYASTLCAVAVPQADLETTAARVTPLAGVTHCYAREGTPNLWFTLTAKQATFAATLKALRTQLAPLQVHSLPARRMFKIAAVFGNDAASAEIRSPVPPIPASFPSLDRDDQAIVRLLQGSLPLVSQPFDAVADQVALAPEALLARCRHWRDTGVIRRVGLVLHHREFGLIANSMCVWAVPEARIEAAGRLAAASRCVSHCYERTAFPGFPGNLYAMVHAETRAAAVAAVAAITAAAALPPGRMLWSQHEFKKTSPRYFDEPDADTGDKGIAR